MSQSSVVMLPGWKFMVGSVVAALAILAIGHSSPLPVWVMAAEIFATIIGLFVFGSFKYQVHKNALTYGMVIVITATFFTIWWPSSAAHSVAQTEGLGAAWWPIIKNNFLSWKGLDGLIHADTMLFILGLTLFVSVIAQTRLLETITFKLLHFNKGYILPTVIAVTAVVGFSSGILDGVSMIGLTIRTLVIILMLASAPLPAIRFAIIICTIVTTVCGMWLAYGEPPNLIMKSNLTAADGSTYLTDGFFLRYCAPAAFAAFLVVAWHLWRMLKGQRVNMEAMDVIDANADKVRFVQAQRHGEVVTPIELVEDAEAQLGDKTPKLLARLKTGESLGLALVREDVPAALRKEILSKYVDAEVSDTLDQHYQLEAKGDHAGAKQAEKQVNKILQDITPMQTRAVHFGLAALALFVVVLISHALNHAVPLFAASFGGFFVALAGIMSMPKMRALAMHEAKVEFAEYYFLFPLFFSITLLMKVGFFSQLQSLLDSGIHAAGVSVMALLQFYGCTFLSAILDNNVVADFASHALHDLDVSILHLFAMSQIAGYALGGCWTHIGSAQSVVAFAFIQRDVDDAYTPVQWMKNITPIILQIIVVMTLLILLESALLSYLH